jgi:hypothetical protein
MAIIGRVHSHKFVIVEISKDRREQAVQRKRNHYKVPFTCDDVKDKDGCWG